MDKKPNTTKLRGTEVSKHHLHYPPHNGFDNWRTDSVAFDSPSYEQVQNAVFGVKFKFNIGFFFLIVFWTNAGKSDF